MTITYLSSVLNNYQSWADDNSAAKMWPCFQASKLLVIALFLYLLWLLQLENKVILTFFEFILVPKAQLCTLLRCRYRELNICRVPSSENYTSVHENHCVRWQTLKEPLNLHFIFNTKQMRSFQMILLTGVLRIDELFTLRIDEICIYTTGLTRSRTTFYGRSWRSRKSPWSWMTLLTTWWPSIKRRHVHNQLCVRVYI